MNDKSKRVNLERAITRDYSRFLVKRIALAALLVGLGSLLAALLVFLIFGNALFAVLACLVVGFALTNLCFLTIVPPTRSMEARKQLVFAAIHEPKRIAAYDKQTLQLRDESGRLHTMKARDRAVWANHVVPYLIASQAEGDGAVVEKAPRQLTASERKYIEQRRKEVLDLEASIAKERKRIELDRKEIEVRTADLNDAEEVVISRLNTVEQAEAELEQLKIAAAERAEANAVGSDPVAAQAKEAELHAKEAELIKMRERLAVGQKMLEEQKAQMEQLRKTTTRAPFPAGSGTDKEASLEQSLESREAALEDRMKELEAEAREIEERVLFVTESENSLIERLDALTHREANIEQNEINSGLRQD
jgi:hypothetical protein